MPCNTTLTITTTIISHGPLALSHYTIHIHHKTRLRLPTSQFTQTEPTCLSASHHLRPTQNNTRNPSCTIDKLSPSLATHGPHLQHIPPLSPIQTHLPSWRSQNPFTLNTHSSSPFTHPLQLPPFFITTIQNRNLFNPLHKSIHCT